MGKTLFYIGKVTIWAAIVGMAAAGARAEDREFYVNTFRSIGTVTAPSVRSAAMGRAGLGLADGVNSMAMNPAGLGAFSGTGYDVGLGFDWLDDGRDDTTQYTFKVGGAISLDRIKPTWGPNQAVGGMIQNQHFSGAGGTDMKRDQTGFMMAYGIHLLDDFLAGVSVSVFDGSWKSAPTTVFDDDGDIFESVNMDRRFVGGDFRLGGIYRYTDETTVGGTINYATGNFRERAAYAGDAGSGSIERFAVGLGVAHQYCENTLLLGDLWFDRVKTKVPGVLRESATSWGLSAGVEQSVLADVMALRGGLYYDHTSYSGRGDVSFTGGRSYSKGRFGLTAGLGVRLYQFDIGYSLDVNSGGDIKNVLDVSAEW